MELVPLLLNAGLIMSKVPIVIFTEFDCGFFFFFLVIRLEFLKNFNATCLMFVFFFFESADINKHLKFIYYYKKILS